MQEFSAQGYVGKALFRRFALLAMDFTRAGAVHAQSGAFRARVQWKQDGRRRGGPGPRRPTREAAEDDLESMRSAASGMGREDGLAAMAAEADRLKAGKAPKEQGSVEEFDGVYRADMRWYEGGSQRRYRRPSVAGALSHVTSRRLCITYRALALHIGYRALLALQAALPCARHPYLRKLLPFVVYLPTSLSPTCVPFVFLLVRAQGTPPRRFPKICGVFFPSIFSLGFILKMSFSIDLSHS